jgi:chromosome segregation ATPase
MKSQAGKSKSEIDELRRRYEELRDQRVAAETNLANANAQLEAFKQQARENWGTDDLDALKEKLEHMRVENARRQTSYREHLDQIESELKAVEQKYAEKSDQG